MRWLWLVFVPMAAQAESLVATRIIPADAIVVARDVALVEAEITGALNDPAAAIGLSAKRAIYPGQPILAHDLGEAVVVKRNALVVMHYRRGSLSLSAEGRALEEGVAGAEIRVMALSSKSLVNAVIAPDGSVVVGAP